MFSKASKVDIRAFNDKMGEDKYPFFGLSGSGTDPEQVDISLYTFNNQKRYYELVSDRGVMYTFKLSDNKLTIIDVTTASETTYTLSNNEKVVLAKRPLMSIQQKIDDMDGRRFCAFFSGHPTDGAKFQCHLMTATNA